MKTAVWVSSFLASLFVVMTQETDETFNENRFDKNVVKKGLSLVHEWNQLDWAFPSNQERLNAIQSGEFIPGSLVPIDVEVHYASQGNRHRIFVTVPRFQPGVPASLNLVGPDGLLRPYPTDWSWHRNIRHCPPQRIVSVFRVAIDECNRLWVLDTGKIEDMQVCPAQLLTFDLDTDQILTRYEFPSDQITASSILVTPVVDIRDPPGFFGGQCMDTFVYCADVTAYGLLVYDARRRASWRITNNLFYPYPPWGYFDIAGEQFNLMDGILALALSPYKPGADRTLYFHSLASNTENRVETSVIRNQTAFLSDSQAYSRQFHLYPGTRTSQAAAMAIDKDGIAYFGLVHELSLACWDTNTEYGGNNVVELIRDPVTLQFASGVNVVRNRKGAQELWIMTMRIQKLYTGTLNTNEVNFRIQAAKISDLTRGSRCKGSDSSQKPSNGGYGFYKPVTRPTRPSAAQIAFPGKRTNVLGY